ncbi:hypothetical protein CSV72_02120 [Sporosarcina sp. P20a]|uniref:hypothetical protein n=1 Tax=Sporosarcina sp. P20a TaxID=2048256 RepID=UPI000C16945C|nr:hypothetical protein [Sporosarcina sp. P20a]PIC87966.1 hypothetical protein CSV72_02120 [Sporosarcina sp. P20a]
MKNDNSSIIDFQAIIKKAFEEFKKEAIRDYDELLRNFDKHSAIAIENNVKDGWGLMDSFTPSEYLTPMDYDTEKRDEYFLNIFERPDDKILQVEFKRIIKFMGNGWNESLTECLSAIEKNKYRTVIPFLISILESVMNKTLNRSRTLYGTPLREAYSKKISILPEDLTKQNAIKILGIFDNYVFKNGIYHHNQVPLFNRNLILHGNDKPDRWRKIDALKLITLISSLISVDEELKKQ